MVALGKDGEIDLATDSAHNIRDAIREALEYRELSWNRADRLPQNIGGSL
jgi:hypothetical protein